MIPAIASNTFANHIRINLAKASQQETGMEAPEHLAYIASFIRLFASLCRQRNKDIIQIVTGTDVGLSQNYCLQVLNDNKVSALVKAAIVEFYSLVFVDTEPFESVIEKPFRCFNFDRLKDLSLNERVFIMMSSHSHRAEGLEDAEVLDKINGFHNFTIGCLKDSFSWLPRKVMQSQSEDKPPEINKEIGVNEGEIASNLESCLSEVIHILELQTNVIKLLQYQVNFGLANITLLKWALEISGIVLKLPQDKGIASAKQPSLLHFYSFCSAKKATIRPYQQLVESVLELLTAVGKIRKHYQACAFLKLWHNNISDISQTGMLEAIHTIFNIYCLSPQPTHIGITLSNLNVHIHEIINQVLPDDMGGDNESKSRVLVSMHSLSEIKEERPKLAISGSPLDDFIADIQPLCRQRIPIDVILLELMFSHTKQVKQEVSIIKKHQAYNLKADLETLSVAFFEEKLQQSLIDLPMHFFNQRLAFFKYLLKIELYKGPEERKVYRMLTLPPEQSLALSLVHQMGSHDHSQSHPQTDRDESREIIKPLGKASMANISILTFTSQVNEVLQLESMGPCLDSIQKARLQELVTSLTSFLNTASRILVIKHEQKVQFRKMQNLMRNLGYHTLVLSLFPLEHGYALSEACNGFLLQFVLFNKQNQNLMLQHYDLLLKGIARGIDTSPLLVRVVHSITVQSRLNKCIEELFRAIRRVLSSEAVSSFLNLQNTLNSKTGFDITKKVARSIYMILAYKDTLLGLIRDEYGKQKREYQTLALANLINSPEIARLYEPQFFDLTRKVIQSRNGFLQGLSEDEYSFFLFYTDMIAFIAELSKGFRECTEQARRISDMNFLQECILSRQTYYLLKRELLRWYHLVYFEPESQSGGIRTSLIKLLLKDVIIHDIDQFSQFSPYIGEAEDPEDRRVGKKRPGLVIKTPMEYWWYLGMPRDSEKPYGLLIFAYSLVRLVKKLDLLNLEEIKEKPETSIQES